jgi:hypothetical protein
MGQMSSGEGPRQVIARSAEEWEALWRSHAPQKTLPAVDFSQNVVAAVFLGQRPTGGFVVRIVGTREEGGTLFVQYRETRPASGAITAQVLTAPFHIVALPRHAGQIAFEKADK